MILIYILEAHCHKIIIVHAVFRAGVDYIAM